MNAGPSFFLECVSLSLLNTLEEKGSTSIQKKDDNQLKTIQTTNTSETKLETYTYERTKNRKVHEEICIF